MPEYPRLTVKEAEKFLLRNGFVLDRQKGSHRIYIKIIKQLFEVIHEAEDKGETMHSRYSNPH
jgi:predicted RNA binding protein YcfA (HicA-like mRNA interferase family)